MPNMMQVVRLVATIALLSANATWATPIKFVYTGVGSGTLNGVPFASSAFTITAFADTSSRQNCTVGGCVFVVHTTASIAIPGIGTFDFLTPTETLVGGGIVNFAHAGPPASNLYDLAADPPLLDNYQLDASIGPIIAFGLLNQWAALPLVVTSGGTLIFDDTVGQSSPGSFQATLLPAPPVVVSATSRKVHGAAGSFDLPLSAVPTNPTTEPRTGPAQTIVFTFDKAITSATATVTEGTATAASPTVSGSSVIVNLTSVTNLQYVTVSLTNVASADGGTGGTGSVRVGFLLGDVNQNRVVSLADLGLVNQQLAQSVTSANYLKDVNASGTLSLADKGITNANLAKALPSP